MPEPLADTDHLHHVSNNIDMALTQQLPHIQLALDEAFSVIEKSKLEHSELGIRIFRYLDRAQEQLCQAAESAAMINNHLNRSIIRDPQRHMQMMEDAHALLHKGFRHVAEGIKASLISIEAYTAQIQIPASEAIFAPEPWLTIPHWLMNLLTDTSPLEEYTSPIPYEALVHVTEELTKAYEYVCLKSS